MKRSTKPLLIRLTLIAIVVACGALAIAQAQRSLRGTDPSPPPANRETSASAVADNTTEMAPIELSPETRSGPPDIDSPPPPFDDSSNFGAPARTTSFEESTDQMPPADVTSNDGSYAVVGDHQGGRGSTYDPPPNDPPPTSQTQYGQPPYEPPRTDPPQFDQPQFDQPRFDEPLADHGAVENSDVEPGYVGDQGPVEAAPSPSRTLESEREALSDSDGYVPATPPPAMASAYGDPDVSHPNDTIPAEGAERPLPVVSELQPLTASSNLQPQPREPTQPVESIPTPTQFDPPRGDLQPGPPGDDSPYASPPYQDLGDARVPDANPQFGDVPMTGVPSETQDNQGASRGFGAPLESSPPSAQLSDSTRNTVRVDDIADPDGAPGDALAANATGKPGPSELEGPQSPALTIEKVVPREIRVGAPVKFVLKVRNVGSIAADRVLVRDEVPHGTELVSTVPQAERLSDGALMWQMGTIKPGEEVTATMELLPRVEGQVGSVATVAFQASASARAIATKPKLEIDMSAPRQVLVGEDVVFSIQLTNSGTGTAANIVVQEDVPDGLNHSAGRELEYEVGALKPGETRHLELTLKADKPGLVENVLFARAGPNLSAQGRVQIEIVAPQLEVDLSGPDRRYLQREATYSLTLKNPGTAPAKDVELVAHLPRGFRFVNTNNAGHYDQTTHSVHWSLEELPAREMGSVRLIVRPIEMGQHKIRAEATAQMGLNHAVEKEVLVEGLAALTFTVADLADPIEVGGQTTYEVRVVNQGSKDATNIRLLAAVPPGMRAIGGDGPTQAVVDPRQVTFEPLPRLTPKTDATFKIHVQGEQQGDMRFRVELIADEVDEPVTKEESTRVFAD